MLGKEVKYQAVSVQAVDEAEIEPKRRIVTPACLWSSFSTVFLISIYFAPSIGLTFYQRWFLQEFHFPFSVVLCQLVIKFFLSMLVRLILEWKQSEPRVHLDWDVFLKAVAPAGIASGVDVGFSNWGLELVTISLYTMTKSTTILFILACAILLKLEKKSWSLCVTVVMISGGLIMFTYKSTQFNFFGFVLLLVASLGSGLRWTCAQLLLQKSKLGLKNPVDMVYHVQPWMIVSLIPFAIGFEGVAFVSSCKAFRFTEWAVLLNTSSKILVSAVIAFVMELSEFMVVTYTSSLTLSIAGIFKEVFMLVLAVEWNGDQMSFLNFLGLVMCLCGIASHILHKIKNPVSSQQVSYKNGGDYELGTPLINNNNDELCVPSEEEGTDTEELFNILRRHDR